MVELEIKTEPWQHTCADGCCYTWGTDVYINNEKVTQGDCDDIQAILEEVLIHLNFKIKNNG